MRVYISGAISGVENYMDNFTKAEKYIAEKGHKPVNPAKAFKCLADDWDYESIMETCLDLLDLCDSIYMLKGWEKSCGANREYGYAIAKGKTVVFER